MKNLIKNPRFYAFSSLIAAVPVALFQSIAYLTAYGEAGVNYFSSASLFPKLSAAFSVLSCLLALLSCFISKKQPFDLKSPQGNLSALPAGIGFLAGGFIMFLSNTTKLTYAISIFCLLAAIYHIVSALSLIENTFGIAFIGFSTVIACILLTGYFYFDTSLEMNAPIKVTVMVGFLISMIYFTGEARTLIGTALPCMQSFISLCSVGICALSGIPVPLAFLSGKFDRSNLVKNPTVMTASYEHPEYLAGAIILLGVGISIGWRVYQSMQPRNKEAT